MTDITERLRARRVTNWVHGTGETPVSAGLANDTLCCLAADEIERLRAERDALTRMVRGVYQNIKEQT
jgi:uncharacterized protein (UPF0335 family)